MSPIELSIIEEAERHSRRLGHLAIVASNASWKHDEAIRTVRLAHGAARRDALARLAALIASYDAAPSISPPPVSRLRLSASRIGRTLAGGAVAGLALLAVTFAAGPVQTAVASPAPPAPIMSAADAAQLRALLAHGVAVLRRAFGDQAACPDSALLINPVWRR